MSTVELTRESDGPDLVAMLAEHGLKGELAGPEGHVVIHVEDCEEAELEHAIEGWLHEQGLPLVPVRIDASTFALSPPAG